MRNVTRIQTNDGTIFDDKREAEHYLDVQISDRLSAHASAIVNLTKYQAVKQYLRDNLKDFAEILDILIDLNTFENEED